MRTGTCDRCGTAFEDRSARQNRRFCSDNCRKRHQEVTTGRGRCENCGQPMGVGSGNKGHHLCWACVEARSLDRRATFVGLRKQGLRDEEIAELLGVPSWMVRNEISRARHVNGMDVPPQPRKDAASVRAA